MDFDFFLDLLFPKYCLVCGNALPDEDKKIRPELGGALCASCYGNIELHTSLFCGTCRARLPAGKKICHLDTPFILGAATEYRKENGLPTLVHGLKFSYLASAATPLASLLARYAEARGCIESSMIIIPMPLSNKRERERGFNQSLLISEALGRRLGLPVLKDALTRVRHSTPQSMAKNIDERRRNTEHAFSVILEDTLQGKNLLLIDDVTTSGATFFEAAKTLKGAGAKKILALAVAKA